MDWITLVTSALTAVIAWWMSRYFQFRMNPLCEVLGPKPHPVFGSMREIAQKQAVEPHMEWVQKYGTVFSYAGFFYNMRLFIADREAVRRVYVTNVSNYVRTEHTRKLMLPVVGDSLLSSSPDAHAEQRKLLWSAFGPDKLVTFVDVFISRSKQMLQKWRQAAEKSGDNTFTTLDSVYSLLTLDIIGLVAFNYEFDAVQSGAEGNRMHEAYNTIFSSDLGSYVLQLVFFLFEDVPFLPLPFPKKRREAADYIRGEVQKIISARRNAADGVAREDLLQLIMDAEGCNKISDEDLTSHVLTILVAGHETTATGMQWATKLLSEHPAAVDRLRRELRGKQLDYATIKDCAYLNAVVKEVLRLYPPAPLVKRTAVNDDVINGVRVPKNTMVISSSYVLHRLEENYKNANEFIPERWLDPSSKPSSAAFQTFSLGEYSCIGRRFALYEMAVIIALVYTNFDIDVVEKDYKRRCRITMKPFPETLLKVKPLVSA